MVRLGNTWPCLHDSKLDSQLGLWGPRFVDACEGGVHQFAGVEGEVQVRVGPHCPVYDGGSTCRSGRGAIKMSIHDKFLLRLEPHWVFLNPYPHRAGPKSSPISLFLPFCRRKLLTTGPWLCILGPFERRVRFNPSFAQDLDT